MTNALPIAVASTSPGTESVVIAFPRLTGAGLSSPFGRAHAPGVPAPGATPSRARPRRSRKSNYDYTGKEVTPPVNSCIELTVRVPRAILIQIVLVLLIIWTGYPHR